MILAWLLVRRLRLAVLSLVSTAWEVAAAIWAAVRALNLGTDVVISGLAAGEDRVRKVGRRSRKDTLVGGCVVPITVVAAASSNSTKIEVELLLWVDVAIHSE